VRLPSVVAATVVASLALAPEAAAARRKVFYCGTVRYEAQELGTYQLDDRPPGGGWTKASEQLRRSTLGTWAVCLLCTGADAPAWGCAGSGLGDLRHSFLRALSRDHVDDSESCGDRAVRPGARTVTEGRESDSPAPPKGRASVALTVADGIYTLMVNLEGEVTVTRVAQRRSTTTNRCGRSPPPESSEATVTYPLPVLFAAPPRAWPGSQTVADTAELVEDPEGRTFCPGPSTPGECSHEAVTTLSWQLVRKESDCTARVTRASGEASLNGEQLPSEGEVPLAGGDAIRTGHRGRLELRLSGDRKSAYLFGGEADARLPARPCAPPATKDVAAGLLTGSLYVWVGSVIGSPATFEISTGTAVTGSRGALDSPLRLLFPWARAATRSAVPPDQVEQGEDAPTPEAATLPADWPAGGSAAYLWSGPKGAVGVKVLRGEARVEDPAGKGAVTLAAGEVFRGPALARKRPVVVTLTR
jgi:hypothetical protein